MHGCTGIPYLFGYFIMFNKRINKVFPSIHVFLCLLYKGKSFLKEKLITRLHKLSGWLQSDNFHM